MSTLDRRRFLENGLATLATPIVASALPSTAASKRRVRGANDRLNVAVIGTGGMGTHHLRSLVGRAEAENLDVTLACDVYRRRLNQAIEIMGTDESGGTMEYREVLDAPEVDAVLIATPDHWHTKIAIEAMDAGKDVYCEKPLSLTVEQALECRDAVHRTGRVLQVGPQRTSEDRFWKARRAIAEGRIGKPSWSQGSYCRNSRGGQFNWHIDPDASPTLAPNEEGYVWWDRWLGHEWGLAEAIEWNPDHFFRFRKYFAYNGGVATDLMYHRLAPLLLAISGPNGEYPRRVSAAGGRYMEKDDRDIPDTFFLTIDYPSEHTVLLVSVMTNDVGIDDLIRGQYGTLEFGESVVVREQGTWWREFRETNAGRFPHSLERDENGNETPKPPAGQASFEIHSSPRRDHMGNFLDAIRESDELACNVDLGCATMVAIKMGVEAYRQDKVLLWDAETETVRPG